jgi:hypothetical protein
MHRHHAGFSRYLRLLAVASEGTSLATESLQFRGLTHGSEAMYIGIGGLILLIILLIILF